MSATSDRFIRAMCEVSPAFEESLRALVKSMSGWAKANEAFLTAFAAVPYAPQRQPGWTARQYRAARRQYGREVRAWRRSLR